MNEEVTLPDYLKPRLKVVFIGINPGQYSVSKGHYYARPANKFWELLSECRLVQEKLTCEDDSRVPSLGIGLTDVVKRPTRSANELRAPDFRDGAPKLLRKLRKYRPGIVAFNGVTGYRELRRALRSFDAGRIAFGRQLEPLEGARVFVLPSTSPANARMTRAAKLHYFRQLARWVRGLGD